MTAGTRAPGDFCWVNIMTPEPAKALNFFGAVLGWTFTEMPGMGYGVKAGGLDIGGLFDVVSPRTPNGMPPVIGIMMKAVNADATGAKIKSLGGRADSAFDIPNAGRMAVCHDPNGAAFDIWQPNKMTGTAADTRAHGVPSWFETLTTDLDAATAFYTAAFGWTADVATMPGMTYTTFKLGDVPIAGMMQITPAMGADVHPHWGTYFCVHNVDIAASDAAKLGATIFIPPHPIPNIGRFAGLISPQGVRFYVIEYSV
jgi:predicted enzyme related to lactoylglutathione lyase